MTDQYSRLFDRIHAVFPDLPNEQVVSAWEYNLDRTDPEEKTDGLVVIDGETVIVRENDAEIFRVPLSEVEEFRFAAGVGCVFAELVRKDGGAILISRADCSRKHCVASAVKAANHFLRYGKNAFEKYAPPASVCPKCGRAYRDGSEVCLFCIDRKRIAKRLWDVAKPYKWMLLGSVVLFFVVSAINLITPELNRILVDDYIRSEEAVTLGAFALVILSIFGVQVLQRAVSAVRNWFLIVAGNKVVLRLRALVFEKIQLLSISRISKRTAGELMNRVTNDTGRIRMFIVNQVASILEEVLLFVAVGTALFIYDWRLALLIILPTPFIIVANRALRGSMGKLFHRNWERQSQSNTVLHDIFSGIRVVKSYGMEHRESKRFEEYAAAEKETQLRIETKWAYINPLLSFLMGFGEFILLYYAGNAILGGTMTLGEMSKFSAYAAMIYSPLQFLASLPRQLMMASTSITKVFEILDEQIDVADKKNAVDLDIQGNIEIENACFGYDEAAEVLRDITLSIKPGDFVGLVGKSGVGKSTLINLVMRMYDVDEGSIKIDGVDIRDISQHSLRSQIGVVLQETFLFNGTIFQNIAYAKENATREEVIAAAKAAGAHSFIIKLTDGYDTWVGEKGCSLSGGEKQRIAIARALLHNPKILILDEATASLDTETEKQIQNSLAALSKERTTIAIAHRLSTLRNATRLVVLDRGQIAETGTHDELIEKKGIYYDLVMAQREMSKMA